MTEENCFTLVNSITPFVERKERLESKLFQNNTAEVGLPLNFSSCARSRGRDIKYSSYDGQHSTLFHIRECILSTNICKRWSSALQSKCAGQQHNVLCTYVIKKPNNRGYVLSTAGWRKLHNRETQSIHCNSLIERHFFAAAIYGTCSADFQFSFFQSTIRSTDDSI